MHELSDVHMDRTRMFMFQLGSAVNAAMSDNPGKHLGNILNPPKPIDMSQVHPMLRPGAKKDPNPNGDS